MEDNLTALWRRAALWPENAVSVLEATRAGRQTKTDNKPAAPRNLHSAEFKAGLAKSNAQKPIAVAALDSLSPSSDDQMVRSAYAAIQDVFISPYGSIESWDAIKPALAAWDEHRACASFLEFVVLGSPDPIAVHNAMLFLSYTGRPLAAEDIEALSLHENPAIADRACELAMQSSLPAKDKEWLAFECAKRGTDFSEREVLKNVGPESDRRIKDWVLQRLFADPHPGYGYVIDDYIDIILAFTEKGDLLSALKDKAPADWLIDGALKLFGNHLCNGIDRAVIWVEPGDEAEELESLFLLIDHATSRNLSLKSLMHLSRIFYSCFSFADQSTGSDNAQTTDDEDWLKGRDEDLAAARKIVNFLNAPGNKEKINAALEKTDQPDFDDAITIIENVFAGEYFSTLFNAIKNSAYPAYLEDLRRAVRTEEQARAVIDWAVKWCGINENGYIYFPGRGHWRVLQGVMPLAGKYPGIGGPLILAGLDYRSPAKDEAIHALLAWPVALWPPAAGDRLRLAVKHTLSTHEALLKALEKLDAQDS